jgi:hypothetical protein
MPRILAQAKERDVADRLTLAGMLQAVCRMQNVSVIADSGASSPGNRCRAAAQRRIIGLYFGKVV